MLGDWLRGLKRNANGEEADDAAPAPDESMAPDDTAERPKRGFFHGLCSWVFDDYVQELETRADRAVERHARVRLRTAIYLLLIMIAAACISLIYLAIRKHYGL